MEDLKDRYDIIIGYVAIIISLSSFQEELAQISFNFGLFELNLANYFFYVTLAFFLCLNLYLVPYFLNSTKYADAKILVWIENFSYFAFALFVFLPFIFLLIYPITKGLSLIEDINESIIEVISVFISVTSAALGAIISRYLAKKYKEYRKEREQERFEDLVIKDLENARKLFDDQHYAHSVLETFKVIKIHLYRLLREKDIKLPEHRIDLILEMAKKHDLITETDIEMIKEIREHRNVTAHKQVLHFDREKAKEIIKFAEDLLIRNNEMKT